MGHFDAISVGGGLAGAAFALELARNGLRVAVLERTSGPSLKVCGDFLSWEARDILGYLGIDVARLGARDIGSLRLVTGRQQATASLPFRAAGLSRLRLDEALLAAAESAGVEVLRGEAVTAVLPSQPRACVRAGTHGFSARWVALASGKHNVRGLPRHQGGMTAYKISLAPSRAAASDLDGVVQLVGYRGGYLGACLIENGNASICWVMDGAAMRAAGADWRGQLDHLARRSQAIADLVSGARFLTDRPAAIAGIPYGFKRHAGIAPNVFAVGDQLAVIPSFTGDGTSLALASGIGAARAVLRGQPAGAFQGAFLADVRGQFFWAQAVDAVFKTALTRRIGVGAAAMLPSLVRGIASLTRLRVPSPTAPAQ
jgi:flavin-dependent dehydrogenase